MADVLRENYSACNESVAHHKCMCVNVCVFCATLIDTNIIIAIAATVSMYPAHSLGHILLFDGSHDVYASSKTLIASLLCQYLNYIQFIHYQPLGNF